MSSQNSTAKTLHFVTHLSEIPAGAGRAVEVNGGEIAVFNDNGELRAINNSCPHRGAPLHEGMLSGGKVYCPGHGFDFDLRSGACGAVAGMRVETYEVRVEGEAVYVLA